MPERASVLDSTAVTWFDAKVDAAFEKLRGRPLADRIFYTASELGDFSLLWHTIGTANALRERPGLAGAVRLSTALGIESALVNGLIKSRFRRERPLHELVRPHRLRQPKTTSFPSGHASSAFMAATLLSEGSRLAPVYFALAAVIAASRVHVRIHYPSDVVGGAAIGLALGAAVRRLWKIGV